MADPMRIRVTKNGSTTDVKVLMKYDMEIGQRKDTSGKVAFAWHITNIAVQHSGKTVLDAQFGPAVSKGSFLNLKLKGGAKGSKMTVTWVDSHGDRRTDETSTQ